MNEEEKLAEAYFTLGMKPGGSKDAVNSRWKRLAMVWHSDRFPSEEAKLEADEELKKINNARDILKKHFESNHTESGSCACKSSPAGSKQSSGAGPGPGKRRTTQENDREEAEAARRNKERAERTERESSERAAQEAKAAAEATERERVKQRAAQTVLAESEKLRWKIALCLGAAWVVISVFGFGVTTVKVWWTDLTGRWQREKQAELDEIDRKKAAAAAAAAERKRQDELAAQDQKRRDQEEQDRKDRAIKSAQDAITRQQQLIDHCTSELSKIQAQLIDPAVGDSQKAILRTQQSQNQYWLTHAQDDLKIAQQELVEANGGPVQPPPNTTSNPQTPHLFDLRPPLDINTLKPQTNEQPAPGTTPKLWQDPFGSKSTSIRLDQQPDK